MHANELGALIVDSAVHLHQDLGPGLLEAVYEVILAAKLRKQGFCQSGVPLKVGPALGEFADLQLLLHLGKGLSSGEHRLAFLECLHNLFGLSSFSFCHLRISFDHHRPIDSHTTRTEKWGARYLAYIGWTGQHFSGFTA